MKNDLRINSAKILRIFVLAISKKSRTDSMG